MSEYAPWTLHERNLAYDAYVMKTCEGVNKNNIKATKLLLWDQMWFKRIMNDPIAWGFDQ